MTLLVTAVGVLTTVAVAVGLILAKMPPHAATDENDLPISDALAKWQLIVPKEVGDGNWALFLADATSGSPGPKLTSGNGFVGGPVLSPNRKTVIYLQDNDTAMAERPRSLRVASVSGSGDRDLFKSLPEECDRPVRPAWNPVEETEIALICISDDGDYVLRIMSIDGREIRQLSAPKGKPKMLDPAFSPDGKTLGFWAGTTDGGDGGTLYTVPTTGGTPKPLLASKDAHGRDRDMVFSPDSKYVAFVRAPESGDGGDQILLARANGEQVHPLTQDARFNYTNPTWSPDSARLAYTSNKPVSGKGDTKVVRVWTMTSEGKDQTVLWPGTGTDQQAAASWTPR